MAKTITALYKTATSAGEAVDRLMDKGFSSDDVSVLMNADTQGGPMGWGVTEHEAKLYANGVENGHILVGVKAHNDRADAAVEVLKNTGGGEIHTR